MGNEKVEATQAVVAEAAVRCFARFGVHKTSMTDVAAAAGLSRNTVYRLFESRPLLLEFIASRRIEAMGDELRPYFEAADDLEEALIEGSILAIRVGNGDPLLREIVAQSGEHQIDQFLFKGSEEIQAMMMSLWVPVLDKARARGQISQDVTNAEIVEWIRNQHAVLMLRDDYDEAAQRRVLSTFMVPSVMSRATERSSG